MKAVRKSSNINDTDIGKTSLQSENVVKKKHYQANNTPGEYQEQQ